MNRGGVAGLLMSASWVAICTLGSPASADISANLEVHYEFEDSDNFGLNSAGDDGVPCG